MSMLESMEFAEYLGLSNSSAAVTGHSRVASNSSFGRDPAKICGTSHSVGGLRVKRPGQHCDRAQQGGRCLLLIKETVRVGEQQYRETTLALSLSDRTATKRFWQALTGHVRNGGRLDDPVVSQWFSAERGRVASGDDPRQAAPQPTGSLTR